MAKNNLFLILHWNKACLQNTERVELGSQDDYSGKYSCFVPSAFSHCQMVLSSKKLCLLPSLLSIWVSKNLVLYIFISKSGQIYNFYKEKYDNYKHNLLYYYHNNLTNEFYHFNNTSICFFRSLNWNCMLDWSQISHYGRYMIKDIGFGYLANGNIYF